MRAEEVILLAMTDSIGQVRKAAAVAAGKLQIASAVDLLITRLGDSFYGARMSAVAALLSLDTMIVVNRLADSINSENRLTGDLACNVLGQLGSDEAMEILLGQVHSPNVNRRSHAALAIIAADPYDNCGYHLYFLEKETDRLARIKLGSALADIIPYETE
jgi:HEAT repeat protein